MAVKVAVWGSRGSGKTTLSVKLADFFSKKGSTVLLFCDREVPPLPVLFPLHKDGEILSVGKALSALDITEDVILSSATVSTENNLIYLGYASGENAYSYPAFSGARADYFLEILDRMAEYIVIDCPSACSGDLLTRSCLKGADTVLRLYNPEIASFAFFLSQLPLLADEGFKAERHLGILNTKDADVFLPENEAMSHMKHCEAVLPYSRRIKQLTAEGTLPGGDCGKAYMAAVSKLAQLIKSSAKEG